VVRDIECFERIPSEITKVCNNWINISESVELLEAMDAGKGEVKEGLMAIQARFDKGTRGFLAETKYEFVEVILFTRQAMAVETCCGEITKRRKTFGIILGRYDVTVSLGYGD
jgi:hypothetical protein